MHNLGAKRGICCNGIYLEELNDSGISENIYSMPPCVVYCERTTTKSCLIVSLDKLH
jgi:hypothetical protein